MMVAGVSGRVDASQDHEHPSRRLPLLPSEKDNSNNRSSIYVNGNPKRPKSRNVSSRYLSPSPSTSTSNSSSTSTLSSSSRRFPSPIVSRNSSNLLNGDSLGKKRSVSADRRRPVVSRDVSNDLIVKQSSGGEVSAATKMLVTSTRSLSVSFQGEYFPLPISKTKVAPPSPKQNCVRKGTPERRRSSTPLRGKVDGSGDQVENSKPSDKHRWPARARQGNSLARSLDCSGGERSTVMDEKRSSFDGRLSLDLGSNEPLIASERDTNGNYVHNESFVASDLIASDTDSVSSGSSSGIQGSGGSLHIRSGSRGIVSSARFWQETNSRLRRLQDPGSPLSTTPSSKFIASPSKVLTPRASSPSRGFSSPSRGRKAVSTINNNFIESPSVMSFSIDVRRGKVGENKIFDAHLLRLIYNRHLQWRFVNARTEECLSVQRRIVEKKLWGAWIMISNLRDKVTKKRHRLQLLRGKLKLASILKGHIKCLEEWASLDKCHCISLLGAIEALKASTLRLPVVGGATADVQSLEDAVVSAIDVMQTMLSSIHSYFPKVEEVNSLVNELAKVTAKERASVSQCEGFLSNLVSLEVKDCSLRTHMLQHRFKQKPTS